MRRRTGRLGADSAAPHGRVQPVMMCYDDKTVTREEHVAFLIYSVVLMCFAIVADAQYVNLCLFSSAVLEINVCLCSFSSLTDHKVAPGREHITIGAIRPFSA